MIDETPELGLFQDEDDSPKEECGVFGIYAPGTEAARLTFFALFALQHRGQESAGMAVSDGVKVRSHKEMGLVTKVFNETVLATLPGSLAIGHTRYSTTGSSVVQNAQPLECCLHAGTVAVAHNGNLINTDELKAEMEARGIPFKTSSDSEVMALLIAEGLDAGKSIEEAVRGMMEQVKGAYSLAILTETELIGVRDPYGVRPLCLGRLGDDGWVLASETCALHTVDATFVRDLAPGEMAIIGAHGVRRAPGVATKREALCMLEMIYFARPDSDMYGQSLHIARQRMGAELSRERPVKADLVIGVPDSGTPAALGFAHASGIPFGEGFIKNRYIQRTFIQPDPRMRELGVRMKLTPIREMIKGKRIVMVDDSIVRGTTTGKVVRLLLDAGAAEVHVRITAPPVKFPCFYGIDMATQDQLIASTNSVEEIRQHIGATSLGFLSTEGLARATRVTNDNFCLACFTGDYPIEIPQRLKEQMKFTQEGKFAREMPMMNGDGRNGHSAAALTNGYANLQPKMEQAESEIIEGIDDGVPGG